jgi:predicted ATPase
MSIDYVVLTGGPCAGKSSVLWALGEAFGDKAVIGIEAATEVLALTGLPQADWDSAKWSRLQMTITKLMIARESELEELAARTGAAIGILDRAPDDNRAYPGGDSVVEYFRKHAKLRPVEQYRLVIHLESLAVSQPDRYEALCQGNAFRYEALAAAQLQNAKTLEAWSGHPHRVIVPNSGSLEETIAICTGLITDHMF